MNDQKRQRYMWVGQKVSKNRKVTGIKVLRDMISILLTVFLFTVSVNATPDTLTVCKSCQLTTITGAIEFAVDGDIIQVRKGTYKEGNINVSKELKLIGIGEPVIDGENENEILTVNANNVTISGFTIQNVGTNYLEDRAGINVNRQRGCVIKNNKLINTFFGIYLKKSKDCQIINNEIIGQAVQEISSGNAIHLWHCQNIRIEDNLVKHHRDGIYLEFVDNSTIQNNVSEKNLRYGLHFMFSNNDVYHNNVFKSNGAGVAVMFSRKIVMTQNKFIKNWGSSSYGLLLKEIYDGEIKENEFRENTIGIYAEGANRLNINRNNFISNGWALKILGSSMDNDINNNNFISNTFALTTNSSRNSNNYAQNYWNDYSGYDLDHDGYGDKPYRPVSLFSYIVSRTDPSIILLRSLFVDIINFAEKVTPIFTPSDLVDEKPRMKPIK